MSAIEVQCQRKTHKNFDKLYLIRPLLSRVNNLCLKNYSPHREFSIDEAMVKFRGRLGFRQYMPAKPTKYGIKYGSELTHIMAT